MSKLELNYEEFKEILKKERTPCALVNLDALDENSSRILSFVKGTGKTVRVASKSIRSPWILDYIFKIDSTYKGIMSFTVEEANFLADGGRDNILVAYPTVQQSDMELIAEMTGRGVNVSLIVDSEEHLEALGSIGRKKGVIINAVVELDVSLRRLKHTIHVGARRSPVRDAGRVISLYRYAEKIGGVKIIGVMGYEAHVAGVPDSNPFTRALNPVAKILKKISCPDVARQRLDLMDTLHKHGIKLELVNGGGTGSLMSTPSERAVTEVTVGSGFYCPHLFSYYQGLILIPAAFFALQIVRSSDPRYVTCLGGGYVASGAARADKLPIPYSPPGLQVLPMEGAGEVQTPLKLPKNVPPLSLGDPVIWRHAKAGELMERFNEVLLIRNGEIVGRVPTYRGLGKCFL